MTIKRSAVLWGLSGAAAALVVAGAGALIWQQVGPRAVTVTVGQFPEQLVYVRSDDDIVNGGEMFAPSADSSGNIAIIWIHGWGANFYEPTYVMIARRLAERGLTTVVANTRMHDLGNVAGWQGDKRIRGGGYWGVASEQARDIAAWIDFAESHGFKDVVLVGHSAGWAAVSTIPGREAGCPRRWRRRGFPIDPARYRTDESGSDRTSDSHVGRWPRGRPSA